MADAGTSSSTDIDRKALRALVGRFRARDAARRSELARALTGPQRQLIDALAVLLHSNHAAMPGFIDFEVPAGIDGYSPDRDAIAAARKLALSYTFERFRVRSTAIQSLILEPFGRAAFTVWVIALRAHHEALAPKLAAIARHAAHCEFELSFKMVDALDARSGHAAALGETPKLTLDGIYRDGILLAGRFPIWWLVPPTVGADYVAYCERLRQQRFVSGKDTIDLGATYRIPQRECFIAGTQALQAALTAPTTWLPRLTLIDSYLDGFGTTLADRLKLYMHAPANDASAADNVLLDQIEGYLRARNELDRLDLVREAVLDAHPADRDRWSFAQWRRQDHRVTSALAVSVAKLRAAATDNRFDRSQFDTIAAALDRPRIDNSINAALLPAHWAPELTLERTPEGWQLTDADGSIIAAPRLAAIAIWACRHRLDPRNLKVTQAPQRRRFIAILNALANPIPSIRGPVILVNAEEQPARMHGADERTVVSSFDDALDFSGFRINLIEAIDYVAVDQGALATTHYHGRTGLVAAFARALGDSGTIPRCACIDTQRQHAIESRIVDLLGQARAALAQGKKFAHAIGAGIAVYERTRSTITYRLSDSLTEFSSGDGAHSDAIVFDVHNDRLPAHFTAAQRSPERDAQAPR